MRIGLRIGLRIGCVESTSRLPLEVKMTFSGSETFINARKVVHNHFVGVWGIFEASKCSQSEKMASKVCVEVAYRVRIGVETLPLYATGALSQENLAYRGQALRIGLRIGYV